MKLKHACTFISIVRQEVKIRGKKKVNRKMALPKKEGGYLGHQFLKKNFLLPLIEVYISMIS